MRRRATFVNRKNVGDPTLLVHLNFDGNTLDEKGNTVSLINPSDAVYVTGVDGQAISLGNSVTTSEKSYISITSTSELQNISSEFTISFWIKGLGASSQNIFSNYTENKPGIYLNIHDSERIIFNIRRPDNSFTYMYSSNFITGGALTEADIWHHFSWTYDGDMLRCYYDFTEFNSLQVGVLEINTTDDWSINRRNTIIATAYYDDFKFFNRALSSTEISNL